MKTAAVVLAGGISKRFSPLITSKPLFPFFSEPVIFHTLRSLKNAGFLQIVVILNPEDEKILSNSVHPVLSDVEICVQNRPDGMAGGLLSAEKHIKGQSIFVINATDLVDQSLYIKSFKQIEKGKSFIVAKKVEEYFDGGYLTFKGEKLSGILEKPGKGNEPSDLVNLVFHYFNQADKFLKLLKEVKSRKDDSYEKALTEYILKENVEAVSYSGYWSPLKYAWQVLDMMNGFLCERLMPQNKAVEVAKSAHLFGDVYLAKGVRVLENAVIKGPAFIGENTTIGTNSLVVESMIDKNCIVGFGSEVTRSYLGNGCWLHRNYIGDSVLEADVHLGAGAVTANFRLDHGTVNTTIKDKLVNTGKVKLGAVISKGVRIGVNSSLMPGVNLGSQAQVGPGVVVYGNLPSRSRILLKRENFLLKTEKCDE